MATVTVSGVTSTNLVISAGTSVLLCQKGRLNDAAIKNGGILYVVDDGITARVYISSGGTMFASAGGSPFYAEVLSSGHMYVGNGGAASFTKVSKGGFASVYGGGLMYSTTVLTGASLCVLNGGTANSVTLNDTARLYIFAGGTASNAELGNRGYIFVESGSAFSVTVKGGGVMFLGGNGGRVYDAVMSSGGTMHVSNGGVASRTKVYGNGHLWVHGRGRAESTTVYDNGHVSVYGAGTMSSTTVGDAAELYVLSGGSAEQTVFGVDAKMYVSSGGVARIVTMSQKGSVFVQGGRVSSSVLKDGGVMHVSTGGFAGSVTLSSGGSLLISSGGIGDNVTVSAGGSLCIYGSGRADNTSLCNSGSVGIAGGGRMINTIMDGWTSMCVSDGGMVDATTLNGMFAYLYVVNGGTARVTVVKEFASTIVRNGVASDTILRSRGGLLVSQGGVADSVTVSNGGSLYISNGGKATGELVLNSGAVVSAYAGSIIDFDISKLAPASAVRVSDVTWIQGTPDYTITVSANQLVGSYALAGEAYDFNKTLTVKTDTGTNLGMIKTGGGTLVWGDYTYTLYSGNDRVLTLLVESTDVTPPAAPTVKASTTAPTNQNVTLTATFGGDCALKQYSFDNRTWNNYTAPVSVSANGTYYFRGIDGAGNLSPVKTVTVLNIDKTAPAAPTLKVSTTAPTNKDVTITATFSTDSVQKQYSTDNKTWKSCAGAVAAGANGTYYFRGIDAAGNISDAASIKISNIDKVAPNAPTARASTTSLTNQNITVTATFSSDSAQKQYSTDKRNWKSYTSGITAGANGTLYFRGIDAVGNISNVTSFRIVNIDKAMPTVKASTTKPTNKDVTITATFTNAAAKKQYSTDKKNWKTYSKALTVSKNATYYFRGIDKNGNASHVVTLKVSNIDKTAPAAPTLTVSTTKLTNKNVTITAKFSSETAKKQYSTDKKNWKSYTAALSVDRNGTYYFRGYDAAGNVSKIKSVKVSNIDKVAPPAPAVKLSTTTATDKSVTVSATFGVGSSKKQYSTDKKNWKTYTKAITAKSNGNYYFRSSDAAGNVSEVRQGKVRNIVDTSNNSWTGATELKGTVYGAIDSKLDKIDCYDVGDVSELMLDMEAGKVKVTFCNSRKKAVKVDMTCADGSVKKLSRLTLTAKDKVNDKITVGDIGDTVRYLKIESVAAGLASYRLDKLA